MLLNISAAMRELGGIGQSTLRKWIREGKVPVVRLGRRVFIRAEVVEDLIQSGIRSGGPPRRAGKQRAASPLPPEAKPRLSGPSVLETTGLQCAHTKQTGRT